MGKRLLTGFLFLLLNIKVLYCQDWESIGPNGNCSGIIKIAPSNSAYVYIGTINGGLYQSINGGEKWKYMGMKRSIFNTISIDAVNPNTLYISIQSSDAHNYTMKSNDGGKSWKSLPIESRCIAVSPVQPNLVFIGTSSLFKSTDGGESFKPINYQFGYNDFGIISFDPKNPNIIYLGTDYSLYKSKDFGETWERILITEQSGTYPATITSINISGINSNKIAVGTMMEGFFFSSDGGKTWGNKETGYQVYGVFFDDNNDDIIYVGDLGGFYISNDFGKTLNQIKASYITSIDMRKNNIHFIDRIKGRSLKSIDKGNNWTYADQDISSANISSILSYNSKIYATITFGYSSKLFQFENKKWNILQEEHTGHKLYYNEYNNSMFMLSGDVEKSVNDGLSWNSCWVGLTYQYYNDLVFKDSLLLVAASTAFEGRDGGIYRSTDNGGSWLLSSDGLPLIERPYPGSKNLAPIDIYTLALNHKNGVLYAGGDALYKSSYLDFYWIKINEFPARNLIIDENNNIIYCIVNGKLYQSTDEGVSIREIKTNLEIINCLTWDKLSNDIYIGGSNGIYRYNPNKYLIDKIGTGIDDWIINSVAIDYINNCIYAGSEESGMCRISRPGDISNIKVNTAHTFLLMQNYPNPFNSSTIIPWEVSKSEIVTLDIYNILGQKIITLIDQNHYSEGRYETYWNGLDIDSKTVTGGVYIYKLSTENGTISKKMIFLK